MEQEKLKVSDVIPLKESTVKDISDSLGRLATIAKGYYEASDDFDVNALERIKRSLLGELQYINTLYSKTRKFKNENHTYLVTQRKAIKGAAIKILLDQGMKITAAEVMVYNSDYYKNRMELLESLLEFFLKTEHLIDHYNQLVHGVIQSISVSSREKAQSIHM
jgi:hypothetical protein